METAPIRSGSLESQPVITALLPSIPFDTTEVRWFARGAMPRQLVGWFTAAGRHGTMEVRRDVYLADGSADIGRKRRNRGPFEIKTRLATGSVVTLAGRLTGVAEEWRKVIGSPPSNAATDDRWTEVHKVVLTRTYHLTDAEDIIEVPANDTSRPGCDVELAAITVAGIEAWTFALEAWGSTELRSYLIERSAAAFVATAGLPESVTARLGEDMSYPCWLTRTVWQDTHLP
jgi:hypothetical protein